ncbi:MAG: hypothetical protein LBJ35_07510 [Spirochaetaceae bacterium]|jgi:hypothetical protein|nr:hypothetical protein [Spirochaetaceae bacterium]
MKKICFIMLFFALGVLATAQEISIDFRYNVLQPEPSRDYFNWTFENKRIQDSYDATTGASRARSTREFDAARYDTMTSRRYTLPSGIRHLMMFPVAPQRYTDNFHLTVQEEGRRLRIRFIVYGTVYQILTDENKKIDVRNSCFFAENITESNSLISPLKARYVKPGGNANDINSLDWSKIEWKPDTADANSSRKYTGALTAGYTNGVLTVKGVLSPAG